MNKSYPLISIVVPAWNEEKYLKTLLPRLVAQDYPNFEIIVVDNNSKDNTAKVASSFGARVISERKQGISHARTKGFRNARGEIIVRTDADTIPGKDWVRRYYQEFRKFPDVVAISGSSQFYDGGLLLRYISKFFFLWTIYLGRLFMGHFPLNGPNFAVRKNIALKISPHMEDSVIHEDMDLSCHFKVHGEIRFNPDLVVSTSSRRLFNDPMFLYRYSIKSFNTFFLHHPSHKLHKVK